MHTKSALIVDHTKSALIVDDSRLAQRHLHVSLTGRGLEVATVASGEQALAHLQNHHPDIVFLDIFMPIMDGFDTLHAIKNTPALSSLAVVMMSSQTDSITEKAVIKAGAAGFLPKPYSSQNLDSVLSAVQNHQQQNASQSSPSSTDTTTRENITTANTITKSGTAQPISAQTLKDYIDRRLSDLTYRSLGNLRADLAQGIENLELAVPSLVEGEIKASEARLHALIREQITQTNAELRPLVSAVKRESQIAHRKATLTAGLALATALFTAAMLFFK